MIKCIIRESLFAFAIFNIFNFQYITISNWYPSELLYEMNENYICVLHSFLIRKKWKCRELVLLTQIRGENLMSATSNCGHLCNMRKT